jgi:hypothetical protein
MLIFPPQHSRLKKNLGIQYFLKVKGILEGITSKTERKFKEITFEAIKWENNQETELGIEATKTVWGEREFYIEDGWVINDDGVQTNIPTFKKVIQKGDRSYNSWELDQYYTDVQIHQFKVYPYQAPSESLEVFNCVCFKNQDPLKIAAQELKYKGYIPLDDSGNKYIG